MTDSQRVTWTLDCDRNSRNVLLSKAINLVKVFIAWRADDPYGPRYALKELKTASKNAIKKVARKMIRLSCIKRSFCNSL